MSAIDAIDISQQALWHAMRCEVPNIKHVLISEDGAPLLGSTHDRLWMSVNAIAITKSQGPFVPCIMDILPVSTKPEMGRVDAETIIAAGTVVQDP